MANADDFGSLYAAVTQTSAVLPTQGGGKKQKVMDDGGTERQWLRVFETLPPQLLNAYGEAAYNRKSDEKVWESFAKPQKSGAKYMTELCSDEKERRGIGINRFLHAVISYCEYQLEEKVRTQNGHILQEVKFKELYAEIDLMLPSLKYCLAPRKASAKSGAASLRAAAVVPEVF